MTTPPWIATWIAEHGGGWAFPLTLTAEHPVVVEGWTCFVCDTPCRAGEVVVPMPFSDLDGPRWIVEHRDCLWDQIRPRDPASLAALVAALRARAGGEEPRE